MKLNQYHKIDYQTYHDTSEQLNALRSSGLSLLRRSPAHYKQAKETPQKETEALRFGKLFHAAIEEPIDFFARLQVMPQFEGVTKDGKPTKSKNSADIKRQEQEWANSIPPDSIILSEDDATTLHGMVDSLMNHKIATGILAKGIPEQSAWVECPETGVTLAFRPDFVHELGFMIDLKSTMDASEDSFSSDIFSKRGRFYLLQAAHYSYCAKIMGHAQHDSFTFIAVEKAPPYCVNVFTLSSAHLDAAEDLRRALTKRYAQCLKINEWPGYEQVAINPLIPGYL